MTQSPDGASLVQATGVTFDLARADEHLSAHLDGLAVVGDEGSKTALDAVQEDPDPGLGEFFAAMVCGDGPITPLTCQMISIPTCVGL